MQIFTRKWSEVSGGRFDPKFLNYTNKIRAKFPITFLNNLLKSSPMYGANEAGISRTSETQPRYIRITDIDDYGCLKEGLGATAQTIQAQYMLEEDDILFARSGATVGKTYIHKNIGYESFFAGYMIKFRVDSSKVLPYFVFIYTQLDIYKEWVKAIQRVSAQPNINAEEYKNLLIPVPPKEIQQKIIDIMDNAYLSKKQKENEAKNILDSIDLYLLGELGIALPCKNTDLSHRIYTTKLSFISGKRFDCEYHQSYYNKLEEAISQGKYQTVIIRDNVFVNQQLESMEKYDFINYIDLSCIEKYNGLIKDTIIINSYFPSRARQKVFKGDLLVSTLSGSMKAIALIEEYKENLIASTGFFVISRVKNISKGFLVSILRTDLFQILLKRETSGSIMSSINYNDFLNLKIPLPPLSVQEKIANEIIKRKQKALKLQKKAKDILEYAKIQVEKIILGEEQ